MKLSNEIIEACEQFAEKNWSKHYNKNNRRSQYQIQNDIRIGKIGEWGFYLSFKDILNLKEPNMNGYGEDGGVDFYSKIGTIDVKTTDYPNNPNLIIPKSQRADIYSLCVVKRFTDEFEHLFSIDMRNIDKFILPVKEKMGNNSYAINIIDVNNLNIPTLSFKDI